MVTFRCTTRIGIFQTVVAERLKLLDNHGSGQDQVDSKLTKTLPLVVNSADGGTKLLFNKMRSQHKATIADLIKNGLLLDYMAVSDTSVVDVVDQYREDTSEERRGI
jgi:hypothetical protein